MSNNFKQLRLRQLDAKLKPWRAIQEKHPPGSGWVRAIREALGMTSLQLGGRMGISQQAVIDLEQREMRGTTTLSALRSAANALDAEVVYAIVPKRPLSEMLRTRAEVRAAELLGQVAHNMSLEAQELPDAECDLQLTETTESLLQSWPRSLWDSTKSGTEDRGRA